MRKRLISVIVPVYNVESYLNRCIDSILNQSYRNLEILLIDDGSTDRSGEICDIYAEFDSRVKVIHKINGGLSDARNIGLNEATGDFVSFVDSDDWLDTSMYFELMCIMEEKNVNIIICRRYRAYAIDQRIIEEYRRYPACNMMSSEEALSNLMTFTGYDMSFCDKVFKRSLFNGIRFPLGKTCEDSFIMYQIISKAQFVYYCHKPFYNYFYRDGSITRNSKVNETNIEATNAQLKFMEQNHPKLVDDAIASHVISFLGVYNEYIKRHQKWERVIVYREYTRKKMWIIIRNKKLTLIKKIQILIFGLSSKMYEILIKELGDKVCRT